MPDLEQLLREAAADLPLPADEATDRALRRALARPVPAAPAHRRAPRLTARLVLVAAAVLVLGGGIAVAFGGRIAELIGSDPTSSTIHRAFERALRPPTSPRRPGAGNADHPIQSSERLVVTHPARAGGDLRIYTARSTRGSTCFLLVHTVALGASCQPHEVGTATQPIDLISSFDTSPHGSGTVYAGRPYSARAVAVRIRFGGGGNLRLALTRRWFFYQPPRAHDIDGAAPIVAIDVLGASGTTIASEPIRAHSLTSILPPQPVLPESSTISLLQRSRLPEGGGLVAIWSGRTAKGEWCLRFLRNGRSQRDPAWDCAPQVGRYWYAFGNPKRRPPAQLPRVPISWQTYGHGGPAFPGQNWVYAVGWAAPGISRLELRYEDGTRTAIPLHGRFYLFLVPASHWAAGARPETVTGLTSAGRRVGSVDLRHWYAYCSYPAAGCSLGTG
jgi:hypothetical protein